MRDRLHCIVCRTAFDFAADEAALILRHVAYGFDFVHDGACAAAAAEMIFPEPGFDCAAFARDPERRRVLRTASAEGWRACERGEPLRCWVLVERRDGTTTMEALIRDGEWLAEPGGAEFATTVRRVHVTDARATLVAAA